MASADDILVDNLTDALQQAQRYLLLGATSALLMVILTLENPLLMKTKGRVEVPTFGELDPGVAAVMFFVGYIAFGVLANSALGRARHLRGAIQDQASAAAALLRFSFATADSAIVRVGSALVPPLSFFVSFLVEANRVGIDQLSSRGIAYQILGFVVISAPYWMLAAALVSPLTAKKAYLPAAENKEVD